MYRKEIFKLIVKEKKKRITIKLIIESKTEITMGYYSLCIGIDYYYYCYNNNNYYY